MQTRKIKKTQWSGQKKTTKKQVRARLLERAGVRGEGLVEKDPVYQLSELFATQFSHTGRTQLGKQADEFRLLRPEAGSTTGEAPEAAQQNAQPLPGYEGAQFREGSFLSRFGEIAFERGDLSAGILMGRGKMLLISALKRAVGQSLPTNQRQRTLNSASVLKNQRGGGQVLYNPGELQSAVGLVVSSIRSGRNALAQFEHAANHMDSQGIQTLDMLYPFLSVKQDRAKLGTYKEHLHALQEAGETGEQVNAMEYGVKKLTAMIHKKERQRLDFITKLQEMSEHAAQAERELSAPDFLADLERLLSADLPPDDEGGKNKPSGESRQSGNAGQQAGRGQNAQQAQAGREAHAQDVKSGEGSEPTRDKEA